jgi:hypothetical protein
LEFSVEWFPSFAAGRKSTSLAASASSHPKPVPSS